MASKYTQALQQQIAELKERVRVLEDQIPPPLEVIPRGRYDAKIVDVEFKTSRLGRTYWSVKFELTKQFKGKPVWANYIDPIRTPFEEMSDKVGVHLDRYIQEPKYVLDPYTALVGTLCKVEVEISTHWETKSNTVVQVHPHD